MKKKILSAIAAAAMVLSICAFPVMAEEEEAADSVLTLAGRTAVMAGGTGNIGRGAVVKMVENGMNVVLETHNPASAEEIAASVEGAPGEVTAISNDTGYDDEFAQVAEEYGSVDVLILATGALSEADPIEDLSIDELNEKIENNIIQVVERVQAALPYLKESEHGRIILTSCSGALDGNETESTLDEICGGAVISMTYAFARELADEGITVNCIARSGMINDHDPEEGQLDVETYIDSIPVGDAGSTENYGALVAYIASEEADYVTGNVFNLSGGLHIGN